MIATFAPPPSSSRLKTGGECRWYTVLAKIASTVRIASWANKLFHPPSPRPLGSGTRGVRGGGDCHSGVRRPQRPVGERVGWRTPPNEPGAGGYVKKIFHNHPQQAATASSSSSKAPQGAAARRRFFEHTRQCHTRGENWVARGGTRTIIALCCHSSRDSCVFARPRAMDWVVEIEIEIQQKAQNVP